MKIKHSKYKNTGILFELLVNQITSDTLKGGDSPAIDIVKQYFTNTSLGREYKLYESILKSKTLNEGRANVVLSTILESSQKFNRSSLKKQKYNLINEIKKHYNIDIFFTTKIKNYKEHAALYTLIEGNNSDVNVNPSQLIDNKITLLEHLTRKEVTSTSKDTILQEFQTYDKDLRILTYQVLLEKFNSKYDGLSIEQKQILKEYINSVDSSSKLREYYNLKVGELKNSLKECSLNVKDKALKIKLKEISKYLVEVKKNDKFTNENLVDLLQYYGLVSEVKKASNV